MHNPLSRHRFTPICQEDLQRVIRKFEVRSDNDVLIFERSLFSAVDYYYVHEHHHRGSPDTPFEKITDNSHELHILDDEQWQSMNAAREAVQTILGTKVVARSIRIAYTTNIPFGTVEVFRELPSKLPWITNSAPWGWGVRDSKLMSGLSVGDYNCATRTEALAQLNQFVQEETTPWWRKTLSRYRTSA